MSADQLSLLPSEWNCLDDSIELLRDRNFRHSAYLGFTKTVANAAIANRPGSVILCAGMSDFSASEVCEDIKTHMQATLDLRNIPTPEICLVDTPHAIGLKGMNSALVESYHDAGRLFRAPDRCTPQFQFDSAPSYLRQNASQRVATLLQHRSVSYYLFKNIHLLQRIGRTPEEAQEFIRMIANIAISSGKTHILLGNAATVIKWMETPAIAEAVVPVVLEPYDYQDSLERIEFLSMLAGVDENLPWESGASLVEHGELVHRTIGGSPHRVRKWVIAALVRAKAHAQTILTWDCFIAAGPSRFECKQAELEFQAVCNFLGKELKAPLPPPKPPGRDGKPGDRALGRDQYAA